MAAFLWWSNAYKTIAPSHKRLQSVLALCGPDVLKPKMHQHFGSRRCKKVYLELSDYCKTIGILTFWIAQGIISGIITSCYTRSRVPSRNSSYLESCHEPKGSSPGSITGVIPGIITGVIIQRMLTGGTREFIPGGKP